MEKMKIHDIIIKLKIRMSSIIETLIKHDINVIYEIYMHTVYIYN